MELTGLHLLLTYQCTFECDHCFVWGSPWQSGVMTLENIHHILFQGRELGTIEEVYFEGGEPFLYYAALLQAAQHAVGMGFRVGVVSNAYWATSLEDATACLRPFVGLLHDLSVSSDLYHYNEMISQQAQYASKAAEILGIPIGTISVAQPKTPEATPASGQIPTGEAASVMYRGRAAVKLAGQADLQPWETFTECPYENLRDPGRVHIDPLGYLHLCQGISIGNVYRQPLVQIIDRFRPDTHPIVAPLLAGGPVELVRRYNLSHRDRYADACHLCYESRIALRHRFQEILAPEQMYGN